MAERIKLEQIADAIRAEAAAISGVAWADIGVHADFTDTPAVEVLLGSYRLRSIAAGSPDLLEQAHFQVVFLAPLFGERSDTERELLGILQSFIDRVTDPSFDYTLGGLVEDVRITGGEMDVVNREGHLFRYATADVFAGEVDGAL